jgi:hypothetical protein
MPRTYLADNADAVARGVAPTAEAVGGSAAIDWRRPNLFRIHSAFGGPQTSSFVHPCQRPGDTATTHQPSPRGRLEMRRSVGNSAQLRSTRLPPVTLKSPANRPLLIRRSQVRILPGALLSRCNSTVLPVAACSMSGDRVRNVSQRSGSRGFSSYDPRRVAPIRPRAPLRLRSTPSTRQLPARARYASFASYCSTRGFAKSMPTQRRASTWS